MGDDTTSGGERIGVFGGTFDPPHVGHLVAAVEVRAALGLDRVLLTVANRPWQKVGARAITDSQIRLAMVQAAVVGLPGIEASDLEIRRGGDSYTADTLAELRDAHLDAELFMVVGADTASLLHTWGRVEEVWALAQVVTITRSDTGLHGLPTSSAVQPLVVPIPRIDVSSTDLRRRVATGWPVDAQCPPGVVRIITAEGLYSGGINERRT